jgi:putative heme iron utilization protein
MDNLSDARNLLTSASLGTLGTLTEDGFPYASLVTLARNDAGSPILFLSKLAQHTQNLLRDDRASMLLKQDHNDQDPLTVHRLTLIGRLQATTDPSARTCFLKRQPSAAQYIDFPDFAFYALNVERAHFIAGFGRIEGLPPEELMVAIPA